MLDLHIPVGGNSSQLRAVKLAHTIAWAFFASCVIAIPIALWRGRPGLAGVCIGIVAVEALVLVFNHWRCPLTDVAARYTDDRRANFDIYLPEWLAHYNKQIFGTLYLVGIVWALFAWIASRAA